MSTPEKLITDLNRVIQDAESLLSNTENQASEGFQKARAKFETTLKTAKAELIKAEELVVQKAKDAAKATDTYVTENPWQSVGIAAGIGLLIGVLIARK
jgi:ElaB/YqjD/DUF883 family membrane-anchored ribosome-binding protein